MVSPPIASFVARLHRQGAVVSIRRGELQIEAGVGLDDTEALLEIRKRAAEASAYIRDLDHRTIQRPTKQSVTDDLPLSHAQRMCLGPAQEFLDNRIPVLLELRGRLNLTALELALADVVARHNALQMRFVAPNGRIRGQIDRDSIAALARQDMAHLPRPQRPWAVWEHMHEQLLKVPDLGDPPLSFTLYDMGDSSWLLGGLVQHLVFDGSSAQIFIAELFGAYRWRVLGLPIGGPRPLQYSDFMIWERTWLDDDQIRASEEYWRGLLAGGRPLRLPGSRDDAAALAETAHFDFSFSADECEQAQANARALGATFNVLLLTAVGIVCAQATKRHQSLLSYVSASRPIEFADTIGCFAQTRAFCLEMQPSLTFSEIVDRVRHNTTHASALRRPPSPAFLQEIEATRVSVNYIRTARPASDGSNNLLGLSVRMSQLPKRLKNLFRSDLQFTLTHGQTGIFGRVLYAFEQFDEKWVEAFCGDVKRSLLAPLHNARV